MTLKVEDPSLVLTTLNEEWKNKMRNISETLDSNKEGGEGEEIQGVDLFLALGYLGV